MLKQLINRLLKKHESKEYSDLHRIYILTNSTLACLGFMLIVFFIHIASTRPIYLLSSDIIFMFLLLITLWLIKKDKVPQAVTLMILSICSTIFVQFIPRDLYIQTPLHHTRFLELEVLFVSGLIAVRLFAFKTYHIVIYIIFGIITIVFDYFIVIYRFYNNQHTTLSIADVIIYNVTLIFAGFLSIYAYNLSYYLLRKLRTEMKKVRHLNDTLQMKVRDRTKTLELQNKELAKANFELDNFVYKASHDLRSPLASGLGLIDLIKEEENEETKKRYLSLLEGSILKLDGLVKDILDLSRNARFNLEIEEVNIKKVIKEIVEQYTFDKEAKDIKFLVNIPTNFNINTDLKRIKVVLHNLISNAIRYSIKGRESFIEIESQERGNYLHLLVKDNGQGIATEHLDKIFGMFYRATTNKPGSGLGLYIVKETIEKLKGKIKVKSKLGEGTIFTIILPKLMI